MWKWLRVTLFASCMCATNVYAQQLPEAFITVACKTESVMRELSELVSKDPRGSKLTAANFVRHGECYEVAVTQTILKSFIGTRFELTSAVVDRENQLIYHNGSPLFLATHCWLKQLR